jgi:hypothetical protein
MNVDFYIMEKTTQWLYDLFPLPGPFKIAKTGTASMEENAAIWFGNYHHSGLGK